MTAHKRMAALVIAALLTGYAAPAAAEDAATKRSTGTIVKWALIGAAAGAGIGFLVGFNAYDDAPYAESKMMKANVAGAAIGAGVGFAIGLARSRPATPRTSEAPSLWRPDAPMQMKRDAPPLRISWQRATAGASRE